MTTKLFFVLALSISSYVFGQAKTDGNPDPKIHNQTTFSEAIDVANVKFHRPMKERVTSFGAAVLDDYLYVFSGHDGEAHGFGKDQLCNHFRRIKFDDATAEWEELAMHDPAQSVALVTDGTYLYRIGGLTFLNDDSSEKANFKSTDHFARYDVAKNEWEELAPLPSPRSSLDAAVVGNKIHVVAGWNLSGESSRNGKWKEDILEFDIDQPELGWKSLPGPGYKTRAASAAAFEGKLYLFGGIQDRGMTRQVSVFDPESQTWSQAPEIPSDNSMAGFATSSFATGGKLFVTGYSGIVYSLNEGKTAWENCGRLMYPRFFLRLVPASDNRLLAIGGLSSVTGRTASIESFEFQESKPDLRLTKWSVDFGGEAKHSQSLVLHNKKLFAFGGNSSRRPHDFSEDAFVNECFVFDLEQRGFRKLGEMPKALQSASAIQNKMNSEHSELVLAGGLGINKEGEFGSLDSIYSFDPESEAWRQCDASLPLPRAMFHGFQYEDAVWMIGGSDAGHGAGLDQSVLHWWGDDTNVAVIPELQLPTPRRSFGGILIKDKYYLIGGLADGIVDRVEVLDLKTRQWTDVASPAVSRVFPSVCALGDKIYLYGGFAEKEGHFSAATSLEVYDPKLNTWSIVAKDLSGHCQSMNMMTVGDRLMFYGVDQTRDGIANFVVLDPDPAFEPPQAEAINFSGQRTGSVDEDVKILMRRDENRDGRLDATELGSRLKALIEDGDKNSDGVLERKEVEELMKAKSE